MTQGLAVLRGGHIGGHIVLENVRYFTVKCDFRKINKNKKKARNPSKIKAFRTFCWQGQKGLVSPAGSVGASKHLRCLEVSPGDPHPSARSACLVFRTI